MSAAPNDQTPAPLLPRRFLTTEEACLVYACTADFLERQPRERLPRNKRGHRTVLYDVRDLEALFASFREDGGTRPPENVPWAVYLDRSAA